MQTWVPARPAPAWRPIPRQSGIGEVPARGKGAAEEPMSPALPLGGEVLRRLVDEHRGRCLWSLKADYYPETPGEEALRVLDTIQRHGDLDAFQAGGRTQAMGLSAFQGAGVFVSQLPG
ncbi:MAG: hypothetical protein MZV49_25755 [Rhodopseudomonas palustris]|nr:hypothetical protein [Rhodopseudomonas palustris]